MGSRRNVVSTWAATTQLVRKVGVLLALVMLATLVPTVGVSATIGVSSAADHASVDSEGRWAIVGNGPTATVWVLHYTDDAGWEQKAEFSVGTAGSRFGHAVAVDTSDSLTEPYFAIGDPGRGNAYLFQYQIDGGGVGSLAQVNQRSGSGWFGTSVDLSQDYWVVGAPGMGVGAPGQAILYGRQFAGVTSTTVLDPTGATTNALGGSVVKLVGDEVYVSAPDHNSASGRVYVFDTAGNVIDAHISDVPTANERFGSAMHTDNNRVVVLSDDDIYVIDGPTTTKITAPASVVYDVAISGNLLAVQSSGLIDILTDNGGGSFVALEQISSTNTGAEELSFNGGQLLAAKLTYDNGADALDVAQTFSIDSSVAGKIQPSVGRPESQFGNYVDADNNTLVASRGVGDAPGELIVLENNEGWVEKQIIALPDNAPAGPVAIGSSIIAAVLELAAGHRVVVYSEQGDGTYALTHNWALPNSAIARSIAVDPGGDLLAVGSPSTNEVIAYADQGTFGENPQIIVPTGASTATSNFGHDVDFGSTGNLVIGQPETASLTSPSATTPGRVTEWEFTGDVVPFSYLRQILPSTSVAGDSAGWSVAADEHVIAIGSPGIDSVAVIRDGQTDGVAIPTVHDTDAFYGYALDVHRGNLAVSDWEGVTTAFDVYANTITQLESYTAPDYEAGDSAASTFPVAVDNGRVYTGARLEDEQGYNSGAIYNFGVTIPATPYLPRDWLPSVAIDGSWAAVGNPVENQVQILFNDGAGWDPTEVITYTSPDPAEHKAFGAAVAMYGTVLVVGAPEADEGQGELYAFNRANGTYGQTGIKQGNNAADAFGSVLALNGSQVIAGAPVEGGVGSAVVSFVRFDGFAGFGDSVLSSGVAGDGFGASVALGAENFTAIQWVGAPDADGAAGRVYGFRSGPGTLLGIDNGPVAGDRYGTAIDNDGLKLAVAAPQGGTTGGYVRTREWSLGGPSESASTIVGTTHVGDDVMFNGNLVASSSISGGDTHLWSNNGQVGTPTLVTIFDDAATGRDIDLGGLWLIGATDDASTDWADLATLNTISDLSTIPNTPTNKTVLDLGTNDEFGTVIVANDNVWVTNAPNGSTTTGKSVVYVYDRATNDLLQVIDPGVSGFGKSLAILDNRLAIGARDSVHIYDRAGAAALFTLTETLTGADDFGTSVALDNKLLVTGAPEANSNQGSVHVFAHSGGPYVELAESPLTSASAADHELFGASVAVFDDVIVIGADPTYYPEVTDGPGYFGDVTPSFVASFARPDALTPFAEVTRLAGGTNTGFGRSLAFDGTRLVVGVYLEGTGDADNHGIVSVFDHTGGGALTASADIDPSGVIAGGDELQSMWGTSVALEDDIIIIGGPGFSAGSGERGAIVQFQWDAVETTWAAVDFDEGAGLAADADEGDRFGTSVVLAGTDVYVGAPGEDIAGRESGAVYQFGVTIPEAPRTWLPDVAIDGQWAAVGNPVENQVHILFNDGTGWAESEILTASGSLAGQDISFGAAVAMDGTRLIIGAPEATGGEGAIFHFSRSSGTYNQRGFRVNDTATDSYGSVLAIEGSTVIAGRPVDGGLGGALVLFTNFSGFAATDYELTDNDSGSGFGETVEISTDPDTGATLMWVGAPDASASAGRVYGYTFGPGTVEQITFDSGAANDRYGSALDANGNVLAATATQDGLEGGYVRTRRWSEFEASELDTTVITGATHVGDDVVFNGNVLAASSIVGSNSHIWSDNGQTGTHALIATYGDAATGRAIDLDGLWMIGATDNASAAWENLATLVQVDTLGAGIPNAPADKIVNPVGSAQEGRAAAIVANDDIYVVGTPDGGSDSGSHGVVHIYDQETNDLVQTIDGQGRTDFGQALALEGNRLIIGSDGLVDVYDRTGPGSDFTYNNDIEAGGSEGFGASVALHNGLLVVGAPIAQLNAGEVLVFEDDGANFYVELAESPLRVTGSQDEFFGASVAVYDDVIVAGADTSFLSDTSGDTDFSHVNVFWRETPASAFVETQELFGDESTPGDLEGFGRSLAFDGSRLVVGAPLEDLNSAANAENQGVVYVYDHVGDGVFNNETILDPRDIIDSGDDTFARWGTSVALNGNSIVAGGPGHVRNDDDEGALVHFLWDEADGVWNAAEFLGAEAVATDAEAGDLLGSAVAVVGTSVFAAAPGEDTAGMNAGAIYRFTLPEPVIIEPANKLLALAGEDLTDGEVGDLFGFAMATDGNRLVIGAPEWGELPAPIGDVGNGGAGGVFVYLRDDDTAIWEFEAFFANPDAEAEAQFGEAVAVDGDVIVVGAPAEEFTDSGTVWMFNLDTGEQAQVTPIGVGVTEQFGRAVAYETGLLVVGAPGYDTELESNLGNVYIYQDLGFGLLDTPENLLGSVADGQYGRRVSLDNGRLAIGSLDNTGLGLVDVYRIVGGVPEFEQSFSGTTNGGQFGFSVDLTGDRLIVGAPNAESATVYSFYNGAWDSGYPLPDTADAGDDFGRSVAINGTVAVVGESAFDADGTNEGIVHIYGITAERDWELLDTLVAEDAADLDELGFAVEVTSAGEVFGGAPFDDNNNGLDAGGVYQLDVTPPADPGPPVDPASITVDYQLPETVMPGATTITIEGAEVASIEDASGGSASGVVAASLGAIDLDEPPTGGSATSSPLGDVTLGDLGLDAISLSLLSDIPLTEFPVDGGWAQYLVGTIYEGFPLQTVTLGDVYQNANVQSIPLRFTEIQDSPLRFTDIAAAALGSIPIDDIDLDGDPATDSYTEWCDALALQATSCSELDVNPNDGVTLGSISAAGVNLEATPLRFTPLRFTYVEASPLRFTPLRFTDIQASPLRFTPLRFTPLRFTDIEASPLRFTPLRFTPLRFTPLRFTPLRFTPLRFTDIDATPLRFTPLRFTEIPTNIVDCSQPAVIDCSNLGEATLSDAAAAGLLLDDFTIGDIGDDVRATPLRFTPLRFTDVPTNIVDCSQPAIIDCDNLGDATFEDAAAAGLLLDGYTFDDLGDAAANVLRLEEILDGLDEASAAALLAVLDDDQVDIDTLIDEFGLDVLEELTLGDLAPEAIDELTITIGDFFEGIDAEVLAEYSLADFLLLFIPRTSYEWDVVDLSTINIQSAASQAPISASVAFMTSGGDPLNDVTVTIDLPDSALVQSGSFQVSGGARVVSSSVNGLTAVVEISNVAPDVQYTLTFNLLQGLTLGESTSVVSVVVDGASDTASDSVATVEAFEPDNNSLVGSVAVLADNLYLSHIGSPNDVDYFRITVTSPMTSVSLNLGNLAVDLDMVVYGPKLGSIIPDSGDAAASAPDAQFNTGGGGGSLSPVPLNDLPTSLGELQAYGASYFRGTVAEQIDFVAIEPGDYFVQVTGYLGASSPEPYSLRAAVTETVELPCPARTFPFTGGDAGTSSTVSSSANTVVLLNRSRVERIYGPDAATDMVAAAEAMIAAATAGGITAEILDIDALPNAVQAYADWDANPCSVLNVNNVVGAIADTVLDVRANQNIEHLLILGGDDIVPFARVKDGTTIANEQSYTNTFTAGDNNALRTAFSESYVLTDDPYADSAPTPIANTDRVVYIPEIAMGRLVETPAEIISALEHFVEFNGQLDPQTGFVAGYDFLDDGTEEAGDRLDELITPASVQRLINETWTASDLIDGLEGPIGPDGRPQSPDSVLISAHFDHANALPASGNASGDTNDLFDVTDAAEIDYGGSVLFSVGCHGGLSVSDVLVAPTGVVSTDWAQTFLGNGAAAYVANTGYGYGDDTAVALSERIMADFADGLNEYATVGEALLYAKQDYSADLTVYGAFDEKALMEATFYGIPFYRLSNAIEVEEVADPVVETSPETGAPQYTESFDPVIEVTGDGTEDELFSTPGRNGEEQVQVTNGYPILPRFEWEVTKQRADNPNELAFEARGVVLESLVTRDEINVDPATARAVFDLSTNEPNTDASDVTFVLSPAINTYLTPEGIRQNVNMAVGAFESTMPDGSGTMRLFEEFEATVYYAEDPLGDREKPVITEVQANPSGGVFNVSVRVQDDSEIARVMALVTPMPEPNVLTSWELLELSPTGGDLWEGEIAAEDESLQWLIMAVDANGNSAWSMSKDLAFDGLAETSFAPILSGYTAPSPEPIFFQTPLDFSIDVTDFDGDDDAWSLTWDFDDDTTCNTVSGEGCVLTNPTDATPQGNSVATHTYDEPGTYNVKVTVSDSSGKSDTFIAPPLVVVDPEADTDDDDVPDLEDNCIDDANNDQADLDDDDIGDVCDDDIDGDGVDNDVDDFPTDGDRAVTCAPGSYGAFTCVDADPGYFVAVSAALVQTACELGSYQDDAGASSCIDAEVGRYVDTTAATEAVACPEGTSTVGTGSTSVDDCLDDFDADGQPNTTDPDDDNDDVLDGDDDFPFDDTRGIACEPGSYGAFTCAEADPGHFVAAPAALEQTPCEPGRFQDESGQESCKSAPEGTFVDEPGATQAIDCSPGFYQPSAGNLECLPAPPGGFVADSAAIEASFCEPGTYQNLEGQTSCSVAPAGTYVDEDQATEATTCPAGTSSAPGAASIEECFPLPMADEMLMVVGAINENGLPPSRDRAVLALFESLGFDVELANDDDVVLADSDGKDIVVVSSSVVGFKIKDTFDDLTLPLVTWEGYLFDEFGFTDDKGRETISTQTTLNIVDSSHPLSAGYTGSTTVTTEANRFSYAATVPSAQVVATVGGSPVLFGFEAGAELAETFGTAPARRVGLFMNYRAAGRLTQAGSDIVAAAIGWATTTDGVPGNSAPSVDAGPNRSMASVGAISISIDATVNDDGRPVPPGTVTSLWTTDSVGVSFDDPTIVDTTVTVPGPGTYVLVLTADDSELTTTDTVTITVVEPSNGAPSVDAGPSQSIVLPNNVASLAGVVSDDGVPLPSTLTIEWTQFSGPQDGASFVDASSAFTDVTFAEAGQYVLELSVSDGELTTTDRVTINVDAELPDGVNIAYIASRDPLPSGDRPIRDRLIAGGATITVIDDDALLSDYAAFDLIFLSTSVVYAKVGDHFASVDVPLITTEQYLLDDMSMGSARIGASADTTTLRIDAPGDELAASNTGTVTITTSLTKVGYATPGVEATVVASTGGRAVYFAYRTGDEMVDGVNAPARRVFFPATFSTPKVANSTYFGLLDAAVAFALASDIDPNDP